jgi:hypothetical protein
MLEYKWHHVEQMVWNFRQVHNVYRQSGLLNRDDLKPVPMVKNLGMGRMICDSLREWLHAEAREFITVKAVKR